MNEIEASGRVRFQPKNTQPGDDQIAALNQRLCRLLGRQRRLTL
ncbi:hypothetical protein [Marinobacter sp. C18]|nr:hypothetical protein [Marinobacter sp. C18]